MELQRPEQLQLIMFTYFKGGIDSTQSLNVAFHLPLPLNSCHNTKKYIKKCTTLLLFNHLPLPLPTPLTLAT